MLKSVTAVQVRNVFRFSSEDSEFPASNLANKLDKSWRCSRREAGTGRASVTLELDTSSFVQEFEVVNDGSAFIQVDGMAGESTSPVPLLPMRMIMSEQDSKAGSTSTDSTHLFTKADFAADSFRKYKLLVVTVSQPFRLGQLFGIRRILIRQPTYANKIDSKSPTLSDPNKKRPIEFSFLKSSSEFPKKPLLEKMLGLNDAVTDEDFEMGKSEPMVKLATKPTGSTKTPIRNTYFATINEQHDLVYATMRSKKGKEMSCKSISEGVENKEKSKVENKENVSNSRSSDETTPSRKRKKGKLNIYKSPGAKKIAADINSPSDSENSQTTKKRNAVRPRLDCKENSEDDFPEFSLSDKVPDDSTTPVKPRKLLKCSSLEKSIKSSSFRGNKTNKKMGSETENVIEKSCEVMPPSSDDLIELKPSPARWNSAASSFSPQVITIRDIDESPSCRNKNRNVNNESWITDNRPSAKKMKNPRIRLKNFSSHSKDDEVLICNPLPSPSSVKKSSVKGTLNAGHLKSPVLVECPVCGQSFKSHVIEKHANNCIVRSSLPDEQSIKDEANKLYGDASNKEIDRGRRANDTGIGINSDTEPTESDTKPISSKYSDRHNLAVCPVCNDFFKTDIIQTHVNNCLDTG